VNYAHDFWDLFGVPADRWDDLPYDDYLWMKATADKVRAERNKQK